MNQGSYIRYQSQNHQQRKVITVCLNMQKLINYKYCQFQRLCCLQCIGEFHNDHPKDLVELELFNSFIQQEGNKQLNLYSNQIYVWKNLKYWIILIDQKNTLQQILSLDVLLDQIESFQKIVNGQIDKIKDFLLGGIKYWDQQFEGIFQFLEVQNCALTLKKQQIIHPVEANLISITNKAKEDISQIIQSFIKFTSQKLLKFCEIPIKLEGHQQDVNGVVISSDGTRIASGSMDKTVKLWNVQTKQLLQTFQYTGEIYGGVALSSNDKYLAYGGDGDYSIQLYDLQHRKYLDSLIGHKNIILHIVFSKDSQFLFSGGYDKRLLIWDLFSSAQFHSLNTDSTIRTIVHSSDEKLISCRCDSQIFIWEYRTMNKLTQYNDPHKKFGYGLCMSKDSSKLMSCGSDGQILIWNLNNGDCQNININELKILIHDLETANQIQELTYGIGNGECCDGYISISQDMNVLVSGGEYKMVKIWRRE